MRQAKADPKLVGITPAMREGSGMVRFSERFPERYFDVGIAEQHAVTFAGGLACEGMRPVVAIYSTFLQRAYDQLIHDIALQNLPVVFASTAAAWSAPTVPTHNGAFDLSYLTCIPNMVVMTPIRRGRMPQDADHRLPPGRPCRRALPTWHRFGNGH
jgi:1-deoxy-D-xylulose-5-phosphate synthase